MLYLKNKLEDQDLFGFPVVLNFDSKPATHSTICGGSISVVIKTLMLMYTFIVVKSMILMENDRWVSITWVLDPLHAGGHLEDASLVQVSDMDQVALSLGSARTKNAISYDAETRRHIRVEASNFDWEVVQGKRVFSKIVETQEMRPCTISDFERTNDNRAAFFNTQRMGLELLCPENRDDVLLQNIYTMPKGKTFRLIITKCDSSRHEGCEPDQNRINNFVNDL